MSVRNQFENGRSLTWLASTYELVILDTSALQASSAEDAQRERYRRELQQASIKSKNIYTIDEVFIEARLVDLNFPESTLRKVKTKVF